MIIHHSTWASFHTIHAWQIYTYVSTDITCICVFVQFSNFSLRVFQPYSTAVQCMQWEVLVSPLTHDVAWVIKSQQLAGTA